MSKYYGKIGFAQTVNTAPGVWEDVVVERYYKGDILTNLRRWEKSDGVNDNINISNRISIVADSFAISNLYNLKYIEFTGSLWKVTDISVEPPRLVLSIGGVYNGSTDEPSN